MNTKDIVYIIIQIGNGKLLGIFTTAEEATEARLRITRGPSGFNAGEYRILECRLNSLLGTSMVSTKS